uniref:SUN domain-containing protein n=1 Tax=Romanomermis culicivorax TaxID=13658 RepID=A0A915HIR2_ROMCU
MIEVQNPDSNSDEPTIQDPNTSSGPEQTKLNIMERNLTSKAEHFALLMKELQSSIKESLYSEINERILRYKRDIIEFEGQIRDQYQQAFHEFNQKITILEAKPCNCLQSAVGNAESGVSSSNVKSIVQKAIETYDADKTGLPDYASEPAGNLNNYFSNSPGQQIICRWMDFERKPGIAPGLCWAFKGAHGRVVIKLSTTIKVTGVTYEHIPQSIAPQGKIDSAPKKMQLLVICEYCTGLQTESDPRPIVLANFTYEIKGKPLQYFPISEIYHDMPIVELIVWSNHGHPMYTCLYRFRVHGTPVLNV